MNFGSAIIVAHGPSGSTLLMGLLNAIDGCLIRGENDNFFYHLFFAYKIVLQVRSADDE